VLAHFALQPGPADVALPREALDGARPEPTLASLSGNARVHPGGVNCLVEGLRGLGQSDLLLIYVVLQ